MSNNLRTRNGMPFNFVNGLKVRGMDIESLIPGIEGIPEAGSKYQFAGNGSVKSFTLPVTPYNKDAVDVYVKQLYVHPDDYTLVGDTVTLVEAPPAVVAGETYNVVVKVSLTTLNGYVNANRVSFEGENLDDILEKSKPLANYYNLRAYAGAATQVRITDPGIAGFFYYDAADTASVDNGGTVIVGNNGKRWKRSFSGDLNLRWFGAVGNGVAKDTAAWQTAVIYAATNHKALFVPDGLYVVDSKAILDGIDTPFQHIRIYGTARSTGPALQYQPEKAGATIMTNNGGALEVWFRTFSNESIDVRGINFVDVATYQNGGLAATPAIKIKKGDPTPAGSGRYITNNNFSDIAVTGYADPIVFQGMHPKATHSWLNNFIGPTHFTRYYPYMCGTGLVMANCTFNRFRMSESLLFGLSAGGIVLRKDGELADGAGTGGLIFGAFDMVHFEGVAGCFRIPPDLDTLIGPQGGGAGARCQLTLTDVTREFCGIYENDPITGFAQGDPYGIQSPVELTINGRTDAALAYGENSLINIPARSVVSSQNSIAMRTSDGTNDPITIILTPETINAIDQVFIVNPSTTMIKTIIVAEGIDVDFNAEVDVIVSNGSYGIKQCKTYGRTNGTRYRDVTGTSNTTVTFADGGANAMIEILVNNESIFALDIRIRMRTHSRIQTYLA